MNASESGIETIGLNTRHVTLILYYIFVSGEYSSEVSVWAKEGNLSSVLK
jgi:hypothetical protein